MCDFLISQFSVWWAATAHDDGLEEKGKDTWNPNWGRRTIKWDNTLPADFQPTERFNHVGNFAAYPMWFRSPPFLGYWKLNVSIGG